MSFVADGRVGIRSEISGFVVREDMSLEARLKRAYHLACSRSQAAVQQIVAAPESLPADGVPPPQRIEPEPGPRSLPAAPQGLSFLPALHASLSQAWAATVGRLFTPERMKDAGTLLLIGVMLLARLFWRLPVAAKLAVIAGLMVAIMLVWPAPASKEPALRAMITDAPPAGGEAAPQPARPAPATVKWKTIAAPIASFNLEAPELDRAALKVRARTASDGARQELLVWGREDEAMRRRAAFAGAVSLEQYPEGQPAAESHYIDLTRRAAQLGLAVERIGEVIGLETKFGEVDTLEALLASGGETSRCLAFRYLREAPSLQIHGWFCGAASLPLDRATLGCVIDRIDLMRAGSDASLKRYFAGVERARKPCGSARLAVARPGWIDETAAPPALKASILTDMPRR